MHKFSKQSMIFFLAIALILVPFAAVAGAQSEYGTRETDPGAMTVDQLLTRPFGILAMVLGTAIFVVSLPFSATGGNTGEAAQKLIHDPADYTFSRALGDF